MLLVKHLYLLDRRLNYEIKRWMWESFSCIHFFVYTMSQVQICACTRICIWRMYITWLLSEMVYEVYKLSRSHPTRLYDEKGAGKPMIKIAIVEDEVLYAQQLQDFLHQYEKENGELFDITVYTDGDQIVHKYQSQYDLILMDVEMKFMDGMSAAEEIRKMDTEVVIIFITNMAQYAIRGYAVDALDYVLKPVSYFAFSQRLNRAIGRMKKREQKVIMVNIKGGAVRVNIANIYYIESQGHTLILHTILGDYETNGTMKEMEEKLKGMNFCRGNKGYLINLQHVDGIQDGCAMVKGEQLVLSRARKKEFMEELTKYWGEVIK